jgi:hypothetical protein
MMDNRARQAQVGRMRRRAGGSSLPPSRRAATHERGRTAGSRCSSRRLNADIRRTWDRTRIAAPTWPLSASSGSAREHKKLTQAPRPEGRSSIASRLPRSKGTRFRRHSPLSTDCPRPWRAGNGAAGIKRHPVLRRFVLTLTVAISLGGCSYQASSAAFTPEAECARNGGRWHPDVGAYAFCERGGGGGA